MNEFLERKKPLVFDICCGLGGWSEAFIAEGYQAIGFDIEAHDYGNGGYPGTLVVKDIRSISGAVIVAAYGVPSCIVASPPCQEFSYMAMPWSKAKEKMRKILADPAEQVRLKELFNECFRIQREVSEAAGHYVPMVVENVRGAQRWVGKARWNFGSFYLWGDVPALMPIPAKLVVKQPGRNFHFPEKYGIPSPSFHGHNGESSVLRAEGVKAGDRNKARANGGQDFTRIAGQQAGLKLPSENGRRTNPGLGARFTTQDCGSEGVKQRGSGREWFAGDGRISRVTSSKSSLRKQASAEIAKIPRPLAQWIARCFKQREK